MLINIEFELNRSLVKDLIFFFSFVELLIGILVIFWIDDISGILFYF